MSAGIIQILPDALVNQIAAGEVVERPASVVKELLENSFDAGATQVDVWLKKGGIDSIQVGDNGSGIGYQDLLLSVERHATSKIISLSDLDKLSTLGFRGEALASIASVSEFEMKSRVAEAETGWYLQLKGGQVVGEIEPAACAQGTTTSVLRLFAQIPARKKYLKSTSTELGHCARVFRHAALSRWDIAMRLFHEENLLCHWPQQSQSERARSVLQPGFTWVEVACEHESYTVRGYLSPPEWMNDKTDVLLCLNGRMVRNRTLLACVRMAYREFLGPHHEPTGIVYLNLHPDRVDFNVHPQKLEARVLEEQSIFSWLSHVIREGLRGHQHGTLEERRPNPSPEPAWGSEPSHFEAATAVADTAVSSRNGFEVETAPLSASQEMSPPYPNYKSRSAPLLTDIALPAWRTPKDLTRPAFAPALRWRYLGQFHATYLLCEKPDSLVLVDQHALSEKLRYEAILRDMAGKKNLPRQYFLQQLILDLPPEKIAAFCDIQDVLSQFGFETELFGDYSLSVKSAPTLLEGRDPKQVLLQLLDNLLDALPKKDSLNSQQWLQPMLATLACHSAIRAGQLLSPSLAASLVLEMENIEEGWTCPHGRPILYTLGMDAIEKHFRRT